MSEHFACRVLGQPRSTQRKAAVVAEDEAALTAAIIALSVQYGRYRYRRITALLRRDGWAVNVKRVERIWRREELKVPAREPKRARLWLDDGSCLRLRPEWPDHVCSDDFVEHRTHNGRKSRMLNVIDEFTRECRAIRVARKLKGLDVIDVLAGLFSLRRAPGHIRPDNGIAFIARSVRNWIATVVSATAYIEPGSPWKNGDSRELQREAARRAPQWRGLLHPQRSQRRDRAMAEARHTVRPHSSLSYQPPAPEVIIWPTEPNGSVPTARPAIVRRPTMR